MPSMLRFLSPIIITSKRIRQHAYIRRQFYPKLSACQICPDTPEPFEVMCQAVPEAAL